MARNRVFFPQAALDGWIADSLVELSGGELLIKGERRRYRIVEAVRVLHEVSGAADVYDLVGRVKTVNFLTELGAELLGSSMIIGDNAYDIVPGFMGAPLGAAVEARASAEAAAATAPTAPTARTVPGFSKNEEELLAQYLMSKLE